MPSCIPWENNNNPVLEAVPEKIDMFIHLQVYKISNKLKKKKVGERKSIITSTNEHSRGLQGTSYSYIHTYNIARFLCTSPT